MIEPRCPWCGALLEGARKPKVAFDRYELICPMCHKSVTRIPANRINGIFVLMFLVGMGLGLITPIGAWVMGVSGCMIILLQPLGPARRSDKRFSTPMARLDEYIGSYRQSLAVSIQWKAPREGGLRCPWIHLSKGIIVLIGLVDESGNECSNMGCVRLESKSFLGTEQFEMNRISEELPEEGLEPGRKFIIYNHNKPIGEGIIVARRSIM